MRAGEVRAARSLNGLEFHEFDAGLLGVVEIELPFAVATDFGFFAGFDPGFYDLRFDGVDVWNAQRDVVHDAKSAFVGRWGNIEHVLDPVGALGDLHGNPVILVFLHTAVPIRTEAKFIHVETIDGLAIVHDEACVNDANGIGRIRGR